MAQLTSTAVAAAREKLAAANGRLFAEHAKGIAGVDLCRQITQSRDTVVDDLLASALADLGEEGLMEHAVLVAHGGYGRGDLAPSSDIDLMLLHADADTQRLARLAKRFFSDLFDAGLIVGHSVRTPADACRLALADAATRTSLIESRFLFGNEALFHRFQEQLSRHFQSNTRHLINRVVQSRREECHRFGDTVFLLQPNVKQSPGGLRDLQLLRWIGFLWHGTKEPELLAEQGFLSAEDLQTIQAAYEFLLRLRNELHFHARRAADVLDRAEQVRIAALRGYPTDQPLLPVEQFMRDYFRHSSGASHVVRRFVVKTQSRDRVARFASAVFGHRAEGGVRVGISGMFLTREGLTSLHGNLVEIMRVVALSSLYDKPIAPGTWESIRHEATRLPETLPPEACRRFLSLLSHPTRLATLLSDLHDVGILERFIPEFEHARGLLQFNQYHKYTVDVHCLRAVEYAIGFHDDRGPLGQAYQKIKQKHLLHLALLIHDLGKGFEGDHPEVGRQIAARTAARLEMTSHETEILEYLVGHHDEMNHLAFRRDTSDEQLVLQFALKVGSTERLRMLYVLTAADLAAVGPRVWDGWKNEVLADLYHRTMAHLTGEAISPDDSHALSQKLEAVAQTLADIPDGNRLVERFEQLPDAYLAANGVEQMVEDLRLLEEVASGKVVATARYLAETEIVQFTIGASERTAGGIFHRLTGVLSGKGLQIRSAEIHTLSDGLVLDRFWVHDPYYQGQPPDDRFEQINAALVESLLAGDKKRPPFTLAWRPAAMTPLEAEPLQTRVEIDNTTSEQYTILDIFAPDRPGLLYAITQTLFESGLSVARAKISTYGNQIVDVFYVTDPSGRKVTDEPQLKAIQGRLFEVITTKNGF